MSGNNKASCNEYSIETILEYSKLEFYINHGLKYVLVTTPDFDNIYIFELLIKNGTIITEQKVICFANGTLFLENPKLVRENPSLRNIYPFSDSTSKQIESVIKAIIHKEYFNGFPKLISTINTETTFGWILEYFQEVVRLTRQEEKRLTTKERNREINKRIFWMSANYMNGLTQGFFDSSKKQRTTVRPILDFVPDYTVIDIETTGIKPEENEITEIAAIKIRNHEIDSTFQILVNPGMEIPQEVIELTHITNEMVANQPPLEDVFDVFKAFIGDDILVGHNIIGFDAEFINSKMPNSPITNKAVDTMWIAKKIMGNMLKNLKLATVCEALGVKNNSAHRALADVEATYQCYERLGDFSKANNLSIESVRFRDWKASDIKPTKEETISNSLEGKTFVITGNLGNLERKAAFQRIVNRGGIVKDGVTLKTDYLVLGDCKGNTSKHHKALEMQQNGYAIQIIDTVKFFGLVEYKDE
jgi:DNA polymerase-3 subunit epsilon